MVVPVAVTQLSDFGRCLTDAQPVVPIRDSAGRASTFEWQVTTRERSERLRGRTRKDVTVGEVDRSRLPIRRETFDGIIGRTLDGSQPDWNLIGHPTPPEGAPNVLLVLIDDAGFGNPSTFGGPIHTPNYTRVAEGGLRYNRFHVTALCSPTRAALLTGRNNHAVGFGSIGELAGGFPGYSATVPRDCAPLPRILRDNGYSTGGVREMAPDTRCAARSGRPVRSVAERLGLRLLLRDPRRRREPVGSGPGGEPNRSSGLTPGSTTRRIRTTSRMRWPTARSSGCTACARRTPTSRSSCTSRPDAATHHTMWRRSGPTSTRGSSTRAGTSSASRRSRARRSSESFPPTPSSRRATRRSRRGTTFPTS